MRFRTPVPIPSPRLQRFRLCIPTLSVRPASHGLGEENVNPVIGWSHGDGYHIPVRCYRNLKNYQLSRYADRKVRKMIDFENDHHIHSIDRDLRQLLPLFDCYVIKKYPEGIWVCDPCLIEFLLGVADSHLNVRVKLQSVRPEIESDSQIIEGIRQLGWIFNLPDNDFSIRAQSPRGNDHYATQGVGDGPAPSTDSVNSRNYGACRILNPITVIINSVSTYLRYFRMNGMVIVITIISTQALIAIVIAVVIRAGLNTR